MPPRDHADRTWWTALRRHAVTVALVVLALIAGALVFGWDKGNVTTDEADKRKNNLFDAWRSDDVTEVRITAQGRTGTLLRKTGPTGDQSWDVEIDGRRHPAEEQLVADYLGRLEFAESKPGRRRLAPEAVDRAAFKLDAPQVSVSVKMAKLQYGLVIGGPAATGGVYVEVAGKGVAEITPELAAALDVAPDSFRSRKLVPYSSVDLVALKLEGDGGTRSFERAPWSGGRGAGFRWAAGTADAGRRVDARAFDKVLVALGQLQATRFLSQAPGDAARVTLTLQPKAGPSAVISLGGACPDEPDSVLVVRREPDPVVACAAAPALATLSTPADAFVDRRVIGAEADEITEVKMDAGERKLELSRAGAGWHMRAPADRQVSPDEGRGFLDALLAVEAARVAAPDEAAGVSPPRATVRVVSPVGLDAADAGGERVEQVEIGAEGKQLTAVRRLEDGAVLMVRNEAARALMPRDLALRGKKVWSESSRRIESLRVSTPRWTQRVSRDGDGWKMVEPAAKGVRADPGLCNDLAEALANLGAERWVAERDDGGYGLDKPRVTVEAELEPGDAPDAGNPARLLHLEIGAPTTGGAFARTTADPAVFVVPRAMELAADRWLVDRQLLAVDTSKLRKATVSRAEGGRISILREGDAWKLVEPAADPAATTKVAALVSALDDLAAETAVGVGAADKHHGLDKPRLTFVLEGGAETPVRITIGASDSLRGTAIHYARKEGVDATFAIPQAKLRDLDSAW